MGKYIWKKLLAGMLCAALVTADLPSAGITLAAENEIEQTAESEFQTEESETQQTPESEPQREEGETEDTIPPEPSAETTAETETDAADIETETQEESDTEESKTERGTEETAAEMQELLSAEDIASGTYGNITWIIDADGKLTVTGTGEFSDSVEDGSARVPWHNYSNSIKSAEINVSGMTDASWMFFWCTNLSSVKLSNFDTSKVVNMKNMFRFCSSLTSIDLSGIDTSNVVDMQGMFDNCTSLTSIDLSGLNTSNVRNMVAMFYGCDNLTSIDLSGFDTSNVTNMTAMFCGCDNLTSIDLSRFDTSNVTNMVEMFCDCDNLTSIDLSGFDTSNVTSMSSMFENCHSLTSIDLSGFNKIVYRMFRNCASLTEITLPDSVTDIPNEIFRDCISLTEITIPSNVKVIRESAFYNCHTLTKVTIPKSVILIERDAFLGAGNLSDVYYGGSESDWQNIDIRDGNAMLAVATKHFNSAGNNPNDTSIQQKRISFYTPLSKRTHTITMYWGWNMFLKRTPYAPDYQLAKIGLALSGASEHSQQSVESMLEDKLGFETDMTVSIDYEKDKFFRGIPAVTYAHKAIEQENGEKVHVIAVIVRGTDAESFSDIKTDITALIDGFDMSVDNVYSRLETYIEGCSRNKGEITKDNVKFFITGHSLGGVTANGVAKKLNDEYGAENVFSYTFASPKLPNVKQGGNQNIHNILNKEDIVTDYVFIGNRYGDDIWFHKDEYGVAVYQHFSELTNGLKPKYDILGHTHSVEMYMSFLMAKDDEGTEIPEEKKKQVVAKILNFKCPVDVEIYADDADGNKALAGKIKDNKTDNTFDYGMYTYVDGDKKYAYLLGDGEYTVKLYGTGEGTLKYTIQEIDVENNNTLAEKTFTNVALTDGKEMTSSVSMWDKDDSAIDISDKTDTPDVRLIVLGENGKPEKEVLPDGKGTEVPVDGSFDNNTFEGVLPEDIPADGKIPNGLWIAKVPDVTYTGKAMKPEVHIYDSTTRLIEKKDYTISYKNNVNAYVTENGAAAEGKAPTVTVTGKGNYSGKETAVFNILPVTLDSESTDVLDITLAVGTKVQKPVPVITLNGRKLANKKDFMLEYPDQSAGAYKGVGTYQINVVGKGNYQGALTVPMTITDKKLISKASVAKIKAQTYTGNPFAPKPVIKYGRDILAEGTGYELEYQNNTEIGIATILVKGIGDYCGQLRVTFPITGGSLSKAKISDSFKKQMEYTGSSVTQSCTLMALLGQQMLTLSEGKDYTVKYFNNTKAGKATVVYTGKGAFTGTLKKTYTIAPYDIGTDSQKKIKYDSSVISAYAKGGSCPVPTITFGDKVLKVGTDFTLGYKNNKAVSATGAQVIVKGKGNYKGSITIPFQITTQDLSNLTLTATDGVYQAGKANSYKTALKLTDVDGKALSAGKDYNKETIAYTYVNAVNLENGEHRNAGDKVESSDVIPAETELKVTVYAKEGSNYIGSISAFYRVAKADVKKAKVTVKPQTYTGKQIKPGKDELKVEMGKTTLSADDYEIVSYGANIEKGTGTLTIKGQGSYGGTRTVSFPIKTKGFLWWKKP